MTDMLYNVVYQGRLMEGFDLEAAMAQLMRVFSLSREKAHKILKSRRAVLKKGADEDTARRFFAALKQAGLDVVLTRSKPETVRPPLSADSDFSGETPVIGQAADGRATPFIRPADQSVADETTQTPAVGILKIPFAFHGTGMEYFKIWLVNIMLSVLTLGVYSAWAKVRRKQYFYGNTHLQGAVFEYLADPVKILKGRIVVFGIFFLFSILSNLFPLVGTLLSLGSLAVLPWLVVRSLAFNARNSALRNIRFGFDGSVQEAAKVYVLWPLVAVLTLGALFPYVYYRQKKFLVENSSYGKTSFSFTASAREYYRLLLGTVVVMLIGLAVILASGFVFIPLAVVVGLALYLYLFAYYSVKTTNLLYNTTQLAEHRFEARLEVKQYLWIVATNSLATALTLGLFHPWARVRALRYKFEHLHLVAAGDLEGFIADRQKQVGALGDAATEFLDLDFGL